VRALRLLLVGAALSAAAVGPAGAQVISGQLLEADVDRPIPFGEVTILDGEGDVVATTFSDGQGRFAVRLPRSGIYTVYAARLGYFNAVSEGIEVADRQELAIAVRLAPAPVEVDSLAVEVEGRSLPLLRVGFYDRAAAGQGHFITRRDIVSMIGVRHLPDVIREVPGVRISSDGFGRDRVTLRGTFAGSCLPMLVLDGLAIHPPWEDILEVEDIEGVEVYSRPSQIPARFDNLTADRSRGAASARCGIVVAWSRQGTRED